jgi:XTP/dITP diphosphohydrolase
MKLFIATSNPHKLNEISAILKGTAEVGLLPSHENLSIEETGNTFEDNAAQKALFLSSLTDEYILADDSGLSVDSLFGAPGVRSRRYAGEFATDDENNRLLLSRMPLDAPRAARFICALALAKGGRVIKTFRGECAGEIAFDMKGDNGFGYDPVFVLPDGRRMAELSPAEKNIVSHRSAALSLLSEYLKKFSTD